jgi:hypothetical protein
MFVYSCVSQLNTATWQHVRHTTHIGLMDSGCSAQVTFIFSGLLGQNVTFESLTAFNGSTWTNAEALFRTALGLHFGHLYAPSTF